MDATLTATTLSLSQPDRIAPPRPLWRTGIVAGVAAAAATTAVAAIAHASGVSLETGPGEAIPVIGFGQLTLFFAAIGVLIAHTTGRRARQPRSTFVKTTIVLTALSLVPDAIVSAGAATRATLVLTHVVAAAIVIPALSACLPQRGSR